jgi:hypothetical protein
LAKRLMIRQVLSGCLVPSVVRYKPNKQRQQRPSGWTR